MADYNAIVVGAGHNGLTAATVLTKNGLAVLCVEKNNWPGGMAATKELFHGFKHCCQSAKVGHFETEHMSMVARGVSAP